MMNTYEERTARTELTNIMVQTEILLGYFEAAIRATEEGEVKLAFSGGYRDIVEARKLLRHTQAELEDNIAAYADWLVG